MAPRNSSASNGQRDVRRALAASAYEGGRTRPRQAAGALLRLVRGGDRPLTYRTIVVLDVTPAALVIAIRRRPGRRRFLG